MHQLQNKARTVIIIIIIIIKNEKIKVMLCENAAGALYIVRKMCVDAHAHNIHWVIIVYLHTHTYTTTFQILHSATELKCFAVNDIININVL